MPRSGIALTHRLLAALRAAKRRTPGWLTPRCGARAPSRCSTPGRRGCSAIRATCAARSSGSTRTGDAVRRDAHAAARASWRSRRSTSCTASTRQRAAPASVSEIEQRVLYHARHKPAASRCRRACASSTRGPPIWRGRADAARRARAGARVRRLLAGARAPTPKISTPPERATAGTHRSRRAENARRQTPRARCGRAQRARHAGAKGPAPTPRACATALLALGGFGVGAGRSGHRRWRRRGDARTR